MAGTETSRQLRFVMEGLRKVREASDVYFARALGETIDEMVDELAFLVLATDTRLSVSTTAGIKETCDLLRAAENSLRGTDIAAVIARLENTKKGAAPCELPDVYLAQ